MAEMSSSCSHCGNEGHTSKTCSEAGGGATAADGGGGGKGFMLFGVRLMEGSSFRKCASMNNLAQFDHEQQPQDSNIINDVNAGYASDDVVHPSARSRERKRGVAWTEEEHRLFLLGLQKRGKGDWRGISRNFVKTRTPTQVASHAQKYFLRRNNNGRRRRRSSLFDITTDTVLSPTLENIAHQDVVLQPPRAPATTLPVTGASSSSSNQVIKKLIIRPIPPSSKMADLNLNKTTNIIDPLPLSLKLSTPPSSPENKSPAAAARHTSAFQGMPSSNFDSNSGDSIISVA